MGNYYGRWGKPARPPRSTDPRTRRMAVAFSPEIWELVRAESVAAWADKHAVVNEAVRYYVKAIRHERALKRGCKGNWLTGEVIPRTHRMTLEEALAEIERLRTYCNVLQNELMYSAKNSC